MEITKELFQGLIESLLNRTQLVMEETVAEAGLTWQDINKVLLVGGSTRTPFISEMIEGFTGLTPSKELNPDEVVALGAAVQASLVEALYKHLWLKQMKQQIVRLILSFVMSIHIA